MTRVWKIGTRWSEHGDPRCSIISAFRRNNILFIGKEKERDRFLREVKAGDYFAVSEGHNIVAVAKALEDAKSMEHFSLRLNDREKELLEDGFESWVNGVKVKLIDIERISYSKQGSFNEIQNVELKQKIKDLFDNHGKRFSIKSNTYTLGKPGKNEENIILDCKTKYIIPVFQRPYSWCEEQIDKLVKDIFRGYWGDEKEIEFQEPIFIGTMQLSEKKHIDEDEYEQDIIDGQQRLTTMLVLIKILQLKYPDNADLKSSHLNWLETRVGKEQQEYLEYLISASELVEDEQNPYVRNAISVRNALEENLLDEEKEVNFDVAKFLEYLFSKVYFVVIETYAGLSKTIQIFNAINTTGLDLNGEDLFKVRMYEYLRDVKHEDESSFDKIKKLYELVDSKNKEIGEGIARMNDILQIYKDYLIARYNLPVVLFDYGVDRFYEHLFDSILNINKWEHFRALGDLHLDIEELEDIIHVRFERETLKPEYYSADAMFASNAIWWGRYGRYCWWMVYHLLYRQKRLDESEKRKNIADFLVALNKLLFVYSICYRKSIYEMQSFLRQVIKTIVNESFEDVMKMIREKTIDSRDRGVEDALGGVITENAKQKKLICLLSEFLNQDTSENNISALEALLFCSNFDVEHIHATNAVDVNVEYELQNCIGNLAMLEYDINRSLQDKPFMDKRLRYKNSKYNSIRNLCNYDKWEEEEIRCRKEHEVTKMIDYIYSM